MTAPQADRWTWTTTPTPRPAPRRFARWWAELVERHAPTARLVALGLAAAAMAAAEPWLRTRAITVDPRPALVLAATVTASVVCGLLPATWWWARAACVVAAAGLCAAAGGVYVGAGAAVALLTADWAVRGRPPVPGLPDSDPRTAVSTGLVVAGAAAWGTVQTARVGPLLLLAAGAAVTYVGGAAVAHGWSGLTETLKVPHATAARIATRLPAVLGAVVRAVKAVAHWVSITLRYLTFALLSVPAVLVPWAVQRLLVLDPLSTRRNAGTRWLARRRSPDLSTAHPWMVDPAAVPDRPYRRWRVGFAAVLAVPVVLVGATVVGRAARETLTTPPAAFAGSAWWPQHDDDLRTIARPHVAWSPYTAQHVQDVELATITVKNGIRSTWSPPAGAGRRLTVWVYGGSTTFGFGQRDAHTVPSELARVAAEAGYTLDVVNKGVPGDVQADEARRFAWDVSDTTARPDLVVFYDGVNDLAAANKRNGYRTNGDDDAPSLVLGPFRDDYRKRADPFSWLRPEKRPSGRGISPTTTTPVLSTAQLAHRALGDYERSRLVSRSVAQSTRIPVVWFWQPTRVDRPTVDGEPVSGNDSFLREENAAARALLPSDVVDISGVFRTSRAPIFYDDVHTNELGARLVAESMFSALRPQIDAALATKEPR